MALCKHTVCKCMENKSMLDEIAKILIDQLTYENKDLKQQLVYWKNKYTTLLQEFDNGS